MIMISGKAQAFKIFKWMSTMPDTFKMTFLASLSFVVPEYAKFKFKFKFKFAFFLVRRMHRTRPAARNIYRQEV